jgi:undecaprenyl-diphosphatase
MTDFLMALFLGIVEGLTEFIPVSSTAHLILLVDMLKLAAPPGHVFEVFIQLGAIMAVVALYWRRFWHTATTLHSDPVSRHFALALIVGCIPAVIAGGLLHDFIKHTLYSPLVIGIALIAGGIVILLLDKRLKGPRIESVDAIPLKTAFLIGCFQALALIPGVSRSGATIMGALGLGVARPVAAEFSFFLAVPVMVLAVGYDSYKNWDAVMQGGSLGLMLAGLAAAFLTAMLVIKTVLAFISRYGFTPFAWYRIALGILVLVLLSM